MTGGRSVDGVGELGLTDVDRHFVRETAEEISSAPAPDGVRRFGPPAALLGLGILFGWPRIVGAVPGGDFVSPFVMILGVLLLVGGPALLILGGRGGGHAASAAVEAALRRLEDPESDRETAVRAATLLVLHAYARQGPATVHVFDPAEVESRLGSRLPLVVAVERQLVEEGKAYPAFTLASQAE